MRIVPGVAVVAVLSCAVLPASAALSVSTVQVKAVAQSIVANNPFTPGDSHLDSGTGLQTATSTQSSVFPSSGTPTITSTTTTSATSNVDPSGFSGNATLVVDWNTTNTLLSNDPNNTGFFDGATQFLYSFLTTTPYLLIVDITTTSSGSDPEGAMSINHVLSVGPPGSLTFHDLALTGVSHYEFNLGTGAQQLILDHAPNAGMSPLPVGNHHASTQLTFSIVPVPEPATGLLGLAATALLLRRRRQA